MKLYPIEIAILMMLAFLAGAIVSGYATADTLQRKYARCFR
jgi:hypothetical protein